MKLVFVVACLLAITSADNKLVVKSKEIEISLGEEEGIVFEIQNQTLPEGNRTELILSRSPFFMIDPDEVILKNWSASVKVIGLKPVAGAFVEVLNCSTDGFGSCALDIEDAYCRVTVIRSHLLSLFVQLVGWTYFAAWSISFYPQIYLNFKRKSVVGLNFDFLALNFVGFGAYSLFNTLMFYNDHVKKIYIIENPRSPSPVLLNDVVFSVHAFFACSVTIAQCFFFEKGCQRVSGKCICFIFFLVSFGLLSATATVLNRINILSFVTSMSYIKMAVTCCKYFPQAYFNYVRKSTVGWSIGNILLDLTGGALDIIQMILQAINVNDWSAFYTNPVKFGLGMVSIVFDLFFIFQHYIFYRSVDVPHNEYFGVDNSGVIASTPEPFDGNDRSELTEPIINDNE